MGAPQRLGHPPSFLFPHFKPEAEGGGQRKSYSQHPSLCQLLLSGLAVTKPEVGLRWGPEASGWGETETEGQGGQGVGIGHEGLLAEQLLPTLIRDLPSESTDSTLEWSQRMGMWAWIFLATPKGPKCT